MIHPLESNYKIGSNKMTPVIKMRVEFYFSRGQVRFCRSIVTNLRARDVPQRSMKLLEKGSGES